MSVFGFVIGVTIVGAAIGAGMQVSIAMSFLSTETIDSPSIVRRYMYRFFLFCMTFFVSSVTSPLIFALEPLSGLVVMAREADVAKISWAAISLPFALLLFWLDMKFIRSCDARLLAGREAYLVKLGYKTAPKWWEKRERRW